MTLTHLTIKYDRKSKTYSASAMLSELALPTQPNTIVFQDSARALGLIIRGTLIPNWSQEKRQAAIDWLMNPSL